MEIKKKSAQKTKKDRHDKTLPEVVEATRIKVIKERLREFGGNRTHAAKSLGIARQQLHSLINSYGIDIEPPERFSARKRKATAGSSEE